MLKQSGQLNRIAVLKEVLTEKNLGFEPRDFSQFIMGSVIDSGEVVVRQYLLLMFGGLNLNQALLASLGAKDGYVSFPMPKEWRDIITQHGFRVSNFWSALFWQIYIFVFLFYGFATVAKVAIRGLCSKNKRQDYAKPYVYFDGLTVGNLPNSNEPNESYDIISWYQKKILDKSRIRIIRHNASNSFPIYLDEVSILPTSRPLPDLDNIKLIFHYVVWGIKAFLVALSDFISGRWWHAFLFNQAALSKQAQLLPKNYLAKEYLFNNSNWFFRPMWTYEVEKASSKVIFYFYSTNCENLKTSANLSSIPYGWKASTWTKYFVWDVYQADFVKKLGLGNVDIKITKPVWFSDSNESIPILPEKNITIFDVEPFRDSIYKTFCLDFEYYIPSIAKQFLIDIHEVSNHFGFHVVFKKKRNKGKSASTTYLRAVENLLAKKNFISVNSDISAFRLIKHSKITISAPYTSTAHIARELGSLSLYYDPSGLLIKNDSAAHEVELISGKIELFMWFKNYVDNLSKKEVHS